MKKFSEYGLRWDIVESLKNNGIEEAFEIQALTMETALASRDIIGQAKTGSGKTLAFGVPILNKVYHEYWKKHPQAIIIEPTRELASQVVDELKAASATRKDGLTIKLIVGGVPFDDQIDTLENKGADIVVGTPGRLLDLAQRQVLHLENIEILVLDEADEMLNMGFIDDIRKILDKTPAERQTLLFSATMPSDIVLVAHKYMQNPMRISTLSANEVGSTVASIKNFAYRCHPLDKIEVLARIMQIPERGKTIVFTQTKHSASKLCEDLKGRGFNVRELHGNLSQNKREQSLGRFSETSDERAILIATDVAARGIDIDNITHVINYECPDEQATYLHRTGRTGRAGNSGTAITFVDWDDVSRWNTISNELNLELTDPVETYSPSDEYKIQLNIPLNASGLEEGGVKTDIFKKAAADRESRDNRENRGEKGGRGRDGRRGGHGENQSNSRNRKGNTRREDGQPEDRSGSKRPDFREQRDRKQLEEMKDIVKRRAKGTRKRVVK
jgi:superfamily II DNA/RNA helicase